ncbi:MAG: hypothetical protein JXQ75_00315 [Phycisphaerae bacterium]|nr:hypothetical protein [Phycisphaerae bacterium]
MRYAKASRTAWRTALAATICALVCLSGCAERVVMVPPGEPVRLRQTVKNVKVWVADGQGKEMPAIIDIPEGWWTLPDPGPGK